MSVESIVHSCAGREWNCATGEDAGAEGGGADKHLFRAVLLLALPCMRKELLAALLLAAWPAFAAEHNFDFSDLREGTVPTGFRSVVTGEGKPGDWRVVIDEVPSQMQTLTPNAPSVARKPVLAQLSQEPIDEHFPLFIYEGEVMTDFTLTTRFKTVKGVQERMAGIAFRIQNPTNYYVIRASSLGNNVRFYKVLDGQRGPVIGPELPVPSGVWHELTIECKGNSIRGLLNGKEVITANDSVNPFTRGRVGFWTKSDSVSYFSDAKILYKAHEPPAQALVRNTLKSYPRLLGLEVFVTGNDPEHPLLVANQNTNDLKRAGGKIEQDVIQNATPYYGKEKDYVSVVLPLRDRNGDPVAAVRVKMKTFAGQTEQNAFARAMPVVRHMQGRVSSLQDLVE